MKLSLLLSLLLVSTTISFSPSNLQTKHSPCYSQLRSQKKMGGCKPSDEKKTTKSKKLFTFEEARKIARGHGFDSQQEFVEYTCPGAYQIPKDADVVWKEEWRGWDDFLGVTLSFEEGRKVARALQGVTTEQSYLESMKSKTISDDDIASRLPFRPDLKYKEDWLGWDDFLVGK